MNIIGNGSIRRLVLAAALSIGLGFGTHASAASYLVDLNTRTATSLGDVRATAIKEGMHEVILPMIKTCYQR